jgi:Core-2/I-Branching enzyme
MTFAYIIRAHHAPAHLERLVRRLDTPKARFYLHVNRRTDDAVYDEMVERLGDVERVTWLPRVACYWGGFSLLEATLEGVRAVAEGETLPGHVLLLSGQDYPLRSAARIEAFLEERKGTSFLPHWSLPAAAWATEGGGLNRIRWTYLERVRVKTRLLRLPIPRRFPAGFRPYGGMAFWALSGESVAYVDRFVRENPGFMRFFRFVKMPDELFFQTVLMNSPLRDKVENSNLHYLDWSAGTANPAILRKDDLPKLLASEKLFARKFDAAVDAEILDLLDREALHAA